MLSLSLATKPIILATLATFPYFQSVVAVTDLTDTGVTVKLNDIPFYIPPQSIGPLSAPIGQLNGSSSSYGFTPITVIETCLPTFDSNAFESVIDEYLTKDDVFNAGFLQAVLVQYASDKCSDKHSSLTINVSDATLKKYNTAKIISEPVSSSSVVPGPYFLATSTGQLYWPYRLYSDVQEAFTVGLVPESNDSYTEIPAAVPGVSSTTIGVPSRLYFTKTNTLPLAGVRIGIKDIYDVKGVKTGLGNRAWYELYPEATSSSNAVQRLVDAGAVVIGKMKTAQFAAPENARDSMDYLAPFNPRADGYQEPGSSSSGPGTGMASYDWLDLALGSDTGGSIRVPAEDNGIFGNRPTHGLINLTGVMTLAAEFDVAGLLARDPYLWSAAAQVLYDSAPSQVSYPKKIQLFDFPEEELTESDSILLKFKSNLTDFLSANVSTLNYTSLWEKTRPAGTPSTLSELLALTWVIPCAQEQKKLVADPFYADYAKKYNGRTPFVNPSTLATWEFGEQFPDRVPEAIANKTIFMDWWNTRVLVQDDTTCSDSLIVFVAKEATPVYRNAYDGFIGVLNSFAESFISVFSENPEYVIPIGQARYNSTVTNHEEYLPVTVNFMAAKGCDGMLFNLILDLVEAGIVSAVEPGRTIHGGAI
ncbi:hypothetical protein N7495_002510 [Penicillium taxi]|uniref:uncharacterized protein n=1 Tax=Penicillium taxi TaxID=168475 RepID=UPI0025450F58|nr:uncharacterized protein N7495_002510 [Penicillium taxi]KAJ5901982.1 hypothetical protein N7495_002510 [Penicillium taxi]